jgi:glycosyltransferase involved in cell wall biosynthesis
MLSQFDEIWTFSNYDAQVFDNAGIEKEIIRGIPPSISIPDVNAIQRYRENIDSRYPQLLSVFNFEPRKNPAALLRAFAICAGKDENLKLTVKTSGIEMKNFVEWIYTVLTKEEFERIQFRLTVIPQKLDDSELQKLYLNHDIFVLPTRGEGFGLPFIEAMAYGMTVVCPDIGGHRDACDESNSIMVKTSMAPVLAEPGAEPFIGCYWRDIDVDDLADKVLEVAANREQRQVLRANGLETITARNNAAPKAEDRITELH